MSDSESQAYDSDDEYEHLELFDPKCGIKRHHEHRVKDFDCIPLRSLPPHMFASDQPRRRPPVLHFGFPADMEKCEEFARQYEYTESSDDERPLLRFVRDKTNELLKLSDTTCPLKIFFIRRKNRPEWMLSICTNYSGPSISEIGISYDLLEHCEHRLSTEYAAWYLDFNQFNWNPYARIFPEDV